MLLKDRLNEPKITCTRLCFLAGYLEDRKYAKSVSFHVTTSIRVPSLGSGAYRLSHGPQPRAPFNAHLLSTYPRGDGNDIYVKFDKAALCPTKLR
jgi:hypothetical protein